MSSGYHKDMEHSVKLCSILEKIPREELKKIPSEGLAKKIDFTTTTFEKQRLRQYLKEFIKTTKDYDKETVFLASGARDGFELSKALLEGFLQRHDAVHTYGYLGNHSSNIERGGYHDSGWGVFVIKQKTLADMDIPFNAPYEIPLDKIEAILLPSQLVNPVRKEFPRHEQKIMAYDCFNP